MSLLIAFSGQGLQHREMYSLLKQCESGVEWLATAGKILGHDLFEERVVHFGCKDVIYSQVYIALLCVGVFRLLKIEDALLAGYSLGEVSAFCVSANLSIEDVISLVLKRAEIMKQIAKVECLAPTGLLALKGNVNSDQVKDLVSKHQCYIAIINADDHYIVGGYEKELDSISEAANSLGVKRVRKLKVLLPSHTPLLKTASQ